MNSQQWVDNPTGSAVRLGAVASAFWLLRTIFARLATSPAWPHVLPGLLAATLPLTALAADPLIGTRLVAPGGSANTAVIAPGGTVSFEVRIDAPTVASIGASYRLTQTAPASSGYFSITGRSQIGSPFTDAAGGVTNVAATASPDNLLGPTNAVNLGNNAPGLTGVATGSNILVTTITLRCSASTPVGIYRIQPAAAISFATEISTNALGNDLSMSDAFFDIVVSTATVPDAPVMGTATAGDAQAAVTFTAPANNGGNLITRYAVTSSPAGGIDTTADLLSTTRTVSGLSNGTAYTFTVTATNMAGISMPSSTSNSVVPTASTVGMHILDVDANGQYDPMIDGVMIVRYMFGLTGSSITTGAIGPLANRDDSTLIGDYLNSIRPYLDIDHDGVVDALTDGLLIIRYLLGLTGTPLVQGAIGKDAMRTAAADIERYLATLKQ